MSAWNRFLPLLCLVFLCTRSVQSAPLTQAKVTKIINLVEVVEPEKGSHPAILSEVIKDQIGLRTGSKSRSELMFEDQTLTRIGPETYFSFKAGTRDLTLQQGTMLLQVPKGIGGAKIRTAAVTAAITGTTIMMEYVPGDHIKVLVLEGSLRLSRNGVFGDSLLLTPGKMVIMPPDAKRIPDPVSVDLAHVMKTSSLVNMKSKRDARPLPSITLIEKEVETQAKEKSKQGLVDTNLVILGHGTNVVIGSDDVMDTLDQAHSAGDMLLAFGPTTTPTPFPTGTPEPTATATPFPTATPDETPMPTPGDDEPTPTPTATATPTPSATASPTPSATATPTPSATATPTATPTPTATATPSATATATPTATPTPTATATPSATPLPTPDPSATPQPSPISTVDTPPPINVAVTFDATKTIELMQPRIKGGVSLPGSFYKGAAADGPASWFVFGNSSTYDAQRDFDARFGVNYDQSFPAAGIAVIRFASIDFAGPVGLQLNGPINVALIGDSGITSSAGSFSMNLSSLGSFTLATNNGPISLSPATFTATGSTFKFLQFYQRGASPFAFSGTVTMTNASFYIDSGSSLTLGAGGSVSVNRAVFNATGALNLNGTLSANYLQLTSATSIALTNGVSSPNVLFAVAPTFSTTTALSVLGGDLTIGAGGINASGLDLIGFDNIVTSGNLRAENITVNNQLAVGGNFFASTNPFSISAFSIEMTNGLSAVGATGAIGSAGGDVTLLAASLLVDSGPGGINGIDLSGGDGLLGGGGDGGTLNLGTTGTPIAADITVNQPITATSGSSLLTNGAGGTVNATSDGTIAVNSTIKVSDSALQSSRQGGTINLTSNKTTGTAISVSSSAQLLALLNGLAPGPGGTIKLTSAGGDIGVNGTVTADRGTVEVTNNGANGVVNVNNATLHGDVVKAGALGNNGTLNVGGGSIDAGTTIKLYAGGSNGKVNFTDNVTLSGNSLKIIAADAVTIFNGKIVTVLGGSPASVFTNTPNYSGFGGNTTTTGTFGGNGATTQPLAGAPGY